MALYSKLSKEQGKALRKVLAVFYEILFSNRDESRANDTIPFAPDVSFDDDGNGYLCLIRHMQENSVANLTAVAQKISEADAAITALPVSRKAVVSYEVAQLIIHGGKDEI